MGTPVIKALQVGFVGALFVLSTPGAAVAEVIRCEDRRCEGTNSRDTIVASTESNKVVAKGGNDDVELDDAVAVGGDDVGLGGRGRDCIDGGAGKDLMIGGPGNDNRPCEFTAFVNPRAAMTSGPGNDTIKGRGGDDSMDGIRGNDLLIGNRGADLIEDVMTGDRDRLFGGRGNDTLKAIDGDGDDVLVGGPGSDDCSGDEGDVFRGC